VFAALHHCTACFNECRCYHAAKTTKTIQKQVRSYSLVTRAEATISELQARLCSLSSAAGAQSGVVAIKPKRLPGEDLV
jgi:hypothetical protein